MHLLYLNERKQMSAHVTFLLLNLDVYYDYTQSQYKVWHIKINLYHF